jgi:hypothetical protein
VINPTKLVFTVSTDHDKTMADGKQLVETYRLQVSEVGSDTPPPNLFDVDLGKPTPDAARQVILTPPELLTLPLGHTYIAYVLVVGPTGVGVATASPPFARWAPPAPPTAVSLRK